MLVLVSLSVYSALSNQGPFDLLPLDQVQLIATPLFKHLVAENIFVIFAFGFVEVVHVELSYKGGVVFVFKVLR